MRLVDEILRTDRVIVHPYLGLDDNFLTLVKAAIEQSPVIVVDNVVEYFYAVSDKEHWDEKDFPNIAPPFQQFFMETKKASLINSEEHGIVPTTNMPMRWGALIASHEPGYVFNHFRKMGIPLEQQMDASRVKWAMSVTAFMEMDKTTPIPCFWPHWFLAYEDGTPASKVIGMMFPETNDLYRDININLGFARHIVEPFMLAISFMHCKNVDMQPVDAHPKVAKKRLKEHGYTPMRYHVLNIKAMQKVLDTTGRASTQGLSKALHIVRGHFKNYRQHGLFGKIYGTFWWEDHASGSAAKGKVVKDYAVTPPALPIPQPPSAQGSL